MKHLHMYVEAKNMFGSGPLRCFMMHCFHCLLHKERLKNESMDSWIGGLTAFAFKTLDVDAE